MTNEQPTETTAKTREETREETREPSAEEQTAEQLTADKQQFGTLTEAEIEVRDEKARQAFKAELPDLLAAKKRELEEAQAHSDDPVPGSDAAKELIRDAIRQGSM